MSNIYFNDQLALLINQIQLDSEYNSRLLKRDIKKSSILESPNFQDFDFGLCLYKFDNNNLIRVFNNNNIEPMIIKNASGYDMEYIREILQYLVKLLLLQSVFRYGIFTNESVYVKCSSEVIKELKALLETLNIEIDVVVFDSLFNILLENELDNLKSVIKRYGIFRIIGAAEYENVKMFFRNTAFAFDVLSDDIISFLLVR